MAIPKVTFRDLLTDVAAAMDRAYDPVNSINDLTTKELVKIASFANTAMDRIWRPPNPIFAWPWTTDSATITIESDGHIDYADIDDSWDWFNLWSADPRPPDNPVGSGWWVGNSAYPIKCVEDADGIWPRTTGTTVFAFYRLARPKFTSKLVDTSATYNTVGTLVYDGGASGSGIVYKSIATGALGNALTNTAKWTPQEIPEPVANILADMIEVLRLRSKTEDQAALAADLPAQQWLDLEMARMLPRDGSGPPWAYDRRTPFFLSLCRY